jgi:hypothetical protein
MSVRGQLRSIIESPEGVAGLATDDVPLFLALKGSAYGFGAVSLVVATRQLWSVRNLIAF